MGCARYEPQPNCRPTGGVLLTSRDGVFPEKKLVVPPLNIWSRPGLFLSFVMDICQDMPTGEKEANERFTALQRELWPSSESRLLPKQFRNNASTCVGFQIGHVPVCWTIREFLASLEVLFHLRNAFA